MIAKGVGVEVRQVPTAELSGGEWVFVPIRQGRRVQPAVWQVRSVARHNDDDNLAVTFTNRQVVLADPASMLVVVEAVVDAS